MRTIIRTAVAALLAAGMLGPTVAVAAPVAPLAPQEAVTGASAPSRAQALTQTQALTRTQALNRTQALTQTPLPLTLPGAGDAGNLIDLVVQKAHYPWICLVLPRLPFC